MQLSENLRRQFIVCRDFYRAKTRPIQELIENSKRDFSIPKFESDPNRSKIAAVAMLKNEKDYIEEWIRFHALVGIEEFIIYDNGSDDGTPEYIESTEWPVPVRVVDWRSFTASNFSQGQAYAHAVVNYGADCRWMAFIDVDEFLFPLKGMKLYEAMARFEDQPGVSIPWHNFGFGGHGKRPSGLTLSNYTQCASFPPTSRQFSLLRYKTIADPAKILFAGPHTPSYRGDLDGAYNDRGQRIAKWAMRRDDFVSSEVLRINHYFTRSKQELHEKLSKGRITEDGEVNYGVYDRRLRHYNMSVTTDDAILKYQDDMEKCMGLS